MILSFYKWFTARGEQSYWQVGMRSIAFTLVFCLGLANHSQAQPSSRPTAQVKKLEGTASLKGKQAIRVGQLLGKSDILYIKGSVTLRCLNNNTTLPLPSGTGRNTCPSHEATICEILPSCPRGDKKVFGADPRIPYLITPRQTLLLNDRPLIQWQPAAGATRYTVIVQDDEKVLWKTTVAETKVIYGGDALEPGKSYSVIIQADTGITSQEEQDGASPGFQILDSQKRQTLQRALAQAEKSALSPEDLLFLQVDLYQSDYLYSEAIDRLTAYSSGKTTASNPQIAQKNGDLYQDMRLHLLAITQYELAIEKTPSEDWHQRSILYHHLAYSYAMQKNPKAAKAAYEKAADYYGNLDHSEMLQQMQEAAKDQEFILNNASSDATIKR